MAAMEESGCWTVTGLTISDLVMLLTSETAKVQEQSAASLHKAADFPLNKLLIVDAGGIPRLVRLLTSPEPAVQAQAAAALFMLADNSIQNQRAIVHGGAVPYLNRMLGSDHIPVQHEALRLLQILAHTPPAGPVGQAMTLLMPLTVAGAAVLIAWHATNMRGHWF